MSPSRRFRSKPSLAHDREKNALCRPVGVLSYRLLALPTTRARSATGHRTNGGRSINLSRYWPGLVEKSDLRDAKQLRIVDMGSGKGYLTFAAYDYFKNVRGIDVKITGVDVRPDLIEKCNEIARASEFSGLKFVTGRDRRSMIWNGPTFSLPCTPATRQPTRLSIKALAPTPR